MKSIIALSVAFALSCVLPVLAQAQGTRISGLPTNSAASGSTLVPCVVNGNTYGCTANQLALGGLGYTPLNKVGDSMTGVLAPNAGVETTSAATVLNLYSTPPANGLFANGGGAVFSYYPTVGGNNFDVTRGENVIQFTTTGNAGLFESGLVVNSTVNTGALTYTSWVANRKYNVGDTFFGPTLNVYQVTVAGTSASSGTGPTGGAVKGDTLTDGTATIQFLQNNAYFGKAGVAIYNHVKPGAAQADWGMYENNVIDAGTGLTFWAGHEIDVSNNDTACTIYQCTKALFYYGGSIGANPIGYVNQVSPQANGSNTYAYVGYHVVGAHTIGLFTFGDDSSAPVAFGCGLIDGLTDNHALGCFQDRSTGQFGLQTTGLYSLAAVSDPSSGSYDGFNTTGYKTHAAFDAADGTSANPTPYAMLLRGYHSAGLDSTGDGSSGTMVNLKAGQTFCLNSGSDCLYYNNNWNFTNSSKGFIASLSDTGTLILNGGNFGVGSGVPVGYYADTNNLALRTPSSTGAVFFESAGGATIYGSIGASNLNLTVPIIESSYIQTGTSTFANLPTCSAARKGAHYMVTDAPSGATWGQAASGGSSFGDDVFCDGNSWRYGMLDPRRTPLPANDNEAADRLIAYG